MEENKKQDSTFKKGAELLSDFDDKKMVFFERWLEWVVFSLILLALGAATFLTLIWQDKITAELLISTGILAGASAAAFALFNPQGKREEKERNKSYQQNNKVWGELSWQVQNDKPKDFNKFCENETELKRQEKIKSYIRRAVFDINIFENGEKDKEGNYIIKPIKEMDKPELLEFLKRKNKDGKTILTKTQQKYIKRAKSIAWYSKIVDPLKVNRIDPSVVLLGNETSRNYEVGKKEKVSVDQKIFLQRIFSVFVFTILLGIIGFAPTDNVGIALIGEYIIRAAVTFASAIIGLYAGIYAIKVRNDRIKMNILFIKTFTSVEKKRPTH